MIKSEIDTEQLKTVYRAMQQMSGQFSTEISQAVNEDDRELYDHSISAISDFFHIPPETVRYGIDQRYSTSRSTTYTQLGEGEKVPYVQWVTQQDEKVCEICGPRDGEIYPEAEAMEIWPAHPNCRCTLRSIDFGEAMLSVTDETLPPALETTTMEILEGFSDLFRNLKP